MVLRHLAELHLMERNVHRHCTQKIAYNEALEIVGLLAKTLLGASVLSIGNSLHDPCMFYYTKL